MTLQTNDERKDQHDWFNVFPTRASSETHEMRHVIPWSQLHEIRLRRGNSNKCSHIQATLLFGTKHKLKHDCTYLQNEHKRTWKDCLSHARLVNKPFDC